MTTPSDRHASVLKHLNQNQGKVRPNAMKSLHLVLAANEPPRQGAADEPSGTPTAAGVDLGDPLDADNSQSTYSASPTTTTAQQIRGS
jgi:hypothetical protein